ncbi:probable LRR receptor-like serine/threonine-protein kinase At1g53430 isoform X10 [Rosa rugosa]|uniref:probable LRR receptor-like serine/threonine-protein kinase At1g53430 isoform X10 n=1 Tax=Rosa rugosa TaxID=74645 RepID=UPI002B406497|nr:probable LRR receptor-like serine/threonine-protein kinase At1g53430 isoform X10 [Rosa rugosa]
MGTEASLRLVSKLIILCLIFTLWQLGSEFKYQSTAQPMPDEEVRALKEIAYKLELEGRMFDEGSLCNGSSDVGVYCDCSSGTICHVKYIFHILSDSNLPARGLSGVIPEEFANLTYLRSLYLNNNQLTGPIPASLGKLSLLFRLDLSNNQLTGSIPASLGNMKFQALSEGWSLDRRVGIEFTLDLSGNQLSGSIPATLGNLTLSSVISDPEAYRLIVKLKQYDSAYVTSSFHMSLSNNQLTGPIPKSLGNLTFADTIDLHGNFLNASIPASLGAVTFLRSLTLGSNSITGTLPKSFANLTSLKTLAISDVEDSHFQFPPSTQVTSSFRILILRNCSITGQIPYYIGNMSSLSNLDLSFNSLTGSIPDSLKNLDLSYLSFSNNMLTGEVPNWIQNAVWSKMDLSYNNFSKLTFKPSTKLDLNLFSCCCNSSTCLPDTMDPTRIKEKYCPPEKPNYHSLFINCGGGQTFDIVDGNVYDQDNDTSQFYLSPKGNWARSSAGSTVDQNYASNSSIFLKSVRCGLSSEAHLYDRARTSPVSLKYYGFCLRGGKYSVTLHFAEIIDEDNDHRSTNKRVFDVYIQGERKLKDFNIMDKAGGPNNVYQENFTAVNVNDSTLEIHFYSAGEGLDQGPLISAISVTPEYKLHKQLSPLHIALITVASIIVFVLLLLLFAWMMGWLGTDHLQEIDIGLEKPVTLKQLKDATRNFSQRNEIGQGGFGTVYKAEVQGKIVAVKKLSSHSEERIIQLKNEFYNLKSMSQENLVQLLDVYNTKGLHLLIYEYMQNKSLAHALFDPKSKLKLDWEARFNICLGIARGLVYLHEHPRLKMVHRDIKSANILLDGNLKAKISDFGLASLYTEDDQFKFIKVEMPEGYMAPEYVRGVVTSKADVYSFGVVILETVSGRKNAGHKRDSQETEFLLDTACDLQRKGKLVDLVDKTLSNKYDAKQAIIILNLAVKCINISPTLRPTMSEVVSVLVGDKKIEEICSSALIEDINDPHVKEIAEFAVSEYNKKSGKKLELQSLVKGETQVVPGENYKLVIAVTDNSSVAKYEGVVYERIWEHTRELLSFNSHIAQVDSSVSMEVTSRVSTSSNLIKGEDETEHISECTP